MTRYNLWISNYNKPSDELRSYSEKLIEDDYPTVSGKTIRVYVHSRPSAREDITAQLEELRSNGRLQTGDVIQLRNVFASADWKVEGSRVVLEEPDEGRLSHSQVRSPSGISTSETVHSPTEAHVAAFAEQLPRWYAEHKRTMPWRGDADPYRIWVAEVMLQQTRVEQATPYFRRFVEAFPTAEALAEAERDEVLKRWEGLGYYARARHLHEAARIVVDEHGGAVPDSWDDIRALPGIGPYTAAAVLSIAYQKSHAVLDGNVVRLLTRVFAVDEDATKSRTRRQLRQLADDLLEEAHARDVAPGTFNQAMMELGATVCTPAAPRCGACPLQKACAASAEGAPEAYPKKKKKPPVPHHDVAVGILENEAGQLFIQRRPDEGLLGGLWEFPGGKKKEGESLEEACRRELREELDVAVEVGPLFHRLDHAYSHFKITLHAFRCRLPGEATPTPANGQPTRWIAPEALDDYAFPRANRRLIEELEAREQRPTLFDAAAP